MRQNGVIMDLDLELTGNIPNLSVHINDYEKAHRFHLDIGASTTVIFSEIVRELNLVIDKDIKKAKSAKGEIDLLMTTLRSLKIGTEKVTDLKVAISDMKEGKGQCIGEISGALGHDVLKNYYVNINYPKKILSLLKNETIEPNEFQRFNYFDNTHMVSIEGIIDDAEPYWFTLDTGAGGNILNQSLAKKLQLPLQKLDGKALSPSGFIDIHMVSIPNFKTQFKSYNDFNVITMDLDHFDPSGEKRFGGILGYPFFKDSELIIDYPNQRVAIRELNNP
jgi:hypothetical protein